MKIIQTAEPPSIIHAIDMDDREASSLGTRQARSNFKLNVLSGTVIPHASQQTEVSAVHYKAAESRDSQNFTQHCSQ